MSQLVMWNLVVAFALPHIIALVQQPRWSNTVRVVVAAVVSIIGGGATAYFNDDFHNWHDVVGSILIVLVGAISFYNNFWKHTGIPQALEAATSPPATSGEQGSVVLTPAVALAAIFVLGSVFVPLLT
jgi:hypothetical protein